MSNQCLTFRDLDFQIADYLKARLDSTGTRDLVKNTFAHRNLTTDPNLYDYQIVYGENTPIAKPLGIAIVEEKSTSEWFATRIRADQFFFHIDCCTKSTVREVSDEISLVFSSVIRNSLFAFNQLQFEVPDTNTVVAYDSWTGDVNYGYKNDGALKVGRISWWAKVANPFITGEVAVKIKKCDSPGVAAVL